MEGITKAVVDSCVGCNRCVRRCPVELANTTYQNPAGEIKVDIDYTMCINCGRCVSACKHDSRVYEDDTKRFFQDLNSGMPISIIVAPSIRTNIPEYKKLFAYFKKSGIKKIYDVSFGADICTWAHIRYIEREVSASDKKLSLITQPCPVIVSYCEIYKPYLLKHLSPVHSPMACVFIYMKNYKNINHRIAAISPCIAKSHEFGNTELIDYNVTFKNMLDYLNDNNIELPGEEVDFDHDECEIGSLYPKPGGLKENIELYFGKELYVLSSEGVNVFNELNIYAKTETELLPDIFDVLNCDYGCNIGTACSYESNLFEINHAMNKNHKLSCMDYREEYCKKLIDFDNELKISDFLREYRGIDMIKPKITDDDIEKAFIKLDKDSFEKKNFNCSACGSDTCYDMARKIALGVNIPINCIVKNMEDVKIEHREN